MKKAVLICALFAQLFAGIALARGFERNKQFGDDEPMILNIIHRRLSLSESQRLDIQAILQQNAWSANPKKDFSEQQKIMQQLQLLIQSKTLDKAALQRLAEQRGEAVTNRLIQMAEIEHQIWQVLAPEQRQKVQQIMQKRHQHLKKRFHQYQKHRPHD